MYQQKEIIKLITIDGFNTANWASAKKMWYFSPCDYVKSSKKSLSIGEIEALYGLKYSKKVFNKQLN